jgi:hypothetical protein
MAIHTGRVDVRDGDYYGPTVNRCARLRALATGGQVLLSGVTAQLVQATLPRGATLVDLGSHALKDLSAPERVWELRHPQMTRLVAVSDTQPASTAAARQAFKLTDHLNRDAEGREWGPGVSHSANKGFHCYASPTLAALMNVAQERFRLPRLWAVRTDADAEYVNGIVECHEMTALRQVALPTLSAQDYARFAVLCAREAYAGGALETDFADWADLWLGGLDSSGVAARAMADSLESEAHRGSGIMDQQAVMAANAAGAAVHAARTTWMAGRARDAELTSCIGAAGEAVRAAQLMAHLDLAELAETAVPSLAAAGRAA